MNLLDNFQRYIRRNELAAPEDFILLTVSGGVDSMVMLSLFVRSGYRVGVTHCNFQLRGVESEEDEELVRREAEACPGTTNASTPKARWSARANRWKWPHGGCATPGSTN